MDKSYKRFSVITGFVILLIVLIANTYITRRQLGIQVDDQAWVLHSRQILLELTQTEFLLKDAESGQRGFLYTGDPKYLAPYTLAVTQIQPQIESLARLTADDPHQQANMVKLRSLTQDKLTELAQTISLFQSGRAAEAKALVLSDVGIFKMEDIRKLIDQMKGEETSLDATRLATYEKSVGITIASLYLSSVIKAIGLLLLAYFILREMNLREKHARQMEEREQWFRITLTSLGDGVIATDENGRVKFINPVAEQLIGVDLAHAKGKMIQQVFPIFNESTHRPVENPVKKVMELGHVIGLANHTVLRNTNGTLIPIQDSAAPIRDGNGKLIGVVLVFRDATHERKSQEVLRKTEKLAAAARLSATVAHEINNPLEAIGNLLYIAKGTPGVPVFAAQQLELAEQELERVSHITRQTLGFYRESKVPDRIELPALIDSVLRLYSNKLKTKNITVERDFAECPSIHGLEGELKQAMSNLISNAADAVNDNGTIRVILSCIEIADNRVIQVTIEDDGPGIAVEHIDHIFEPFFTTKKDVGTGLGLWVTREIIDRHGGSIVVHSRKDHGSHGTVFNLHLPCNSDLRSLPADEL